MARSKGLLLAGEGLVFEWVFCCFWKSGVELIEMGKERRHRRGRIGRFVVV